MTSVLIRAPLLTQSGYGVHSRQIFRWALEKGLDIKVQILPWGMTGWYTSSEECDGLIGEIMKRSSAPVRKPDLSLQVQLPNEWDPNIAEKNIGITAAVETTVCNRDWIQNCYAMDEVIVPSNFTKTVLISSGHNSCNLHVVSESYYDSCGNTSSKENSQLKNIKTKHNFLLVGQITGNHLVDRKNIGNTITAFMNHFKDRKDVGLIIKTNLGCNSSIDRHRTKKAIHEVVTATRTGDFPRVYLLHGRLTESEMCDLYRNNTVTALISPTRGEGFGLPLLEATACDLPVIATNWSGHLDFLKDCDSFYPIDYDIKTIPNPRVDNNIFVQGSKWAEPRMNSFCLQLDNVITDKKNRKKIDNSNIRSKFSFKAISKQYDTVLGKYL